MSIWVNPYFSIYLYKNYPRSASPFEITSLNPTNRVLIATQGSEFKYHLVKNLCSSLKSPEIYIKGIEVDDVDVNKWDHIIIPNSFIVKLNRKVDRFIKRVNQPDKILLFVTAGGADWVAKPDLEVDAITSASHIEYGDDLIKLIKDWINRDKGASWEPNDYIAALRFFSQVDVIKACENIKAQQNKYENVYPNLDIKINSIGYYYMRLGNTIAAQKIFKLNVDLFPEKSNVHDSYGEALFVNGNIKDAIKSYQQALELNPESESAIEMLSKLKKTSS